MSDEPRTLSARLAWWADKCDAALRVSRRSSGRSHPGEHIVDYQDAYSLASDMLSAVSQMLREESERAEKKLECLVRVADAAAEWHRWAAENDKMSRSTEENALMVALIKSAKILFAPSQIALDDTETSDE